VDARYQRNELGALLKAPSWLIVQIDDDRNLLNRALRLGFWGLVFHAVFGLALGLFGGWSAAWMATVKVPLIAFCSLLLCFPSLYVFACVGGMPLSLSQAAALAGAVLAVTGLLLLALAPVAWLFAVSTNNLAFVVLLTLLIWLVASAFARSFLERLKATANLNRLSGLNWWLVIYLLVTWQMTTFLRPLLGVPKDGWWTHEKMFFLIHFGRSVFGDFD
jgi:hypothetical protein